MTLQQWLLIGLLMVPAIGMAGEIRGTITERGKPVPADTAVDVKCGDKTYSATTDKYGSYRLFVPEKGKCEATVRYQNQTPSREVISFEESTRYDFSMVQQGGQYELRRR